MHAEGLPVVLLNEQTTITKKNQAFLKLNVYCFYYFKRSICLCIYGELLVEEIFHSHNFNAVFTLGSKK